MTARSRRLFRGAAFYLGCLAPWPASAELLRLDHDSPALRAEMIEVLTGLPELLPEPPSVPLEPGALYEDEARSDLALLDGLAELLFAPALPGFGPEGAQHKVALITAPDCPECPKAEADLRDLSEVYDLRVTLINADENADLLKALGLDMVPSYVFPDQMLRGAIPAIVLERYLSD
jgi:thiol-disulfide isomerase/thioredoxin